MNLKRFFMRNKKVLLSILPPWGEPSAPIGLGYISEYLLKNNIEHEIYDFNLEIFNKCHEPDRVLWDSSPIYLPRWMNPDEFKVTLNKFDDYIHEAVNKIISYGADVVAFSINLANRRISIETAQRLRKHRPGTTIIFGGPGIFIYGERSLIPENVIDIFVIGEGEATLLELLQKKVSKRALAGTAGTLTDPKTRQFIPRKAIDLSTHPWPKYTKFDIKKYPNTAKFMHILFGRGCAGRCSFCGDYSFWGRYRNRSPEDVVEEIKYHIQNSD